MANAINWEATPSITADILTTALNSLANNTISSASTEVDNTTGLDTEFYLEVNFTMAVSASDAVPSLDIYMQKTLDGTNYETAPLTGGANQGHMFLDSVQVAAGTGAQRVVLGPYVLPPLKVKFYIDNQTGQALAASGNTLDIGVVSREIQ